MTQLSLLDRLKQERTALTVSELTARIKSLIENQFIDVWVEGEISNFHRHSSGHWYFTLKDEGAMVRCASFRMQNRLIRFFPEDGLRVRARGRLSVYEARGEYQIIVENLEPVGIGALQLALEQLKKKLDAEGLFSPDRKRPLPLLPVTIGIVTSPTGAAIRDILRILERRNEAVSLLIAPAKVQGEGAALEIVQAIELLNQRPDIDVIIVGRGGGSIEDLWCFNEECVARAIYNSRVPVISAVGHETDFTIADFVADLRASTPSAAAEMVAAAREELLGTIEALMDRMTSATRYRLLSLRNELSELEASRAFDGVLTSVRTTSQRFDEQTYALESASLRALKNLRVSLDDAVSRLRQSDLSARLARHRAGVEVLSARLRAGALKSIETGRRRFSVVAGKLDSLSPLAVLSRGYAIAFDENGQIIKRAGQVPGGARVRIRLSEGEMDCTRN